MMRKTFIFLLTAALVAPAAATPVAVPGPAPGYTMDGYTARDVVVQPAPPQSRVLWRSGTVEIAPRVSGQGTCVLYAAPNGLSGMSQVAINANPSIWPNGVIDEARWTSMLLVNKPMFVVNGFIPHPSGANMARTVVSFPDGGVMRQALVQHYQTPGITVAAACVAPRAIYAAVELDFVRFTNSFRNNANPPQPKLTPPAPAEEKDTTGKAEPPPPSNADTEVAGQLLRAALAAASSDGQ